jgi:hypothetical protein
MRVMGLDRTYVALALLWLTLSLGGGALLAALARRLHPALPFRKLWLFYTLLLGLGAGAFFAIGLN